jgi:TorA maturation chaperone TorD
VNVDEGNALEQVARLFGQLLLHELSADDLERLREPEVLEALAAVGVDVPPADTPLDELAAEFFDTLLRPEHGPPVQSLWSGGSYEGDSAAMIRKLAEAAALDFDKSAARGAPLDHIGSILLLWAEARERAPEVAERLQEDHLAWSLAPLRRSGSGDGFYAQLARSVSAFVEDLAAGPRA